MIKPLNVKSKKKLLTDNSIVPFHIFNLGSGRKTSLKKFVKLIEKNTNKKANIKLFPMQLGDVIGTTANIAKTKKVLGYNPKTIPENGIKNFVKWFMDYKY